MVGLNGQWIGNYQDAVPGQLIIDIDDAGDTYTGYAYVNPDNRSLPTTYADLVIKKTKGRKFSLPKTPIFPLNNVNGAPDYLGEFRKAHPGLAIPTYADITGKWSDTSLSLKWTTDLGVKGSATIPRSQASAPSVYTTTPTNWRLFKGTVSKFEQQRFLYRGQEYPWRLRTSFHRTGRANLRRFRNEDMPTLHRHITARTRHVFDLDKPVEFGSFLNLAQHHGYPTPLLDWTYSPYVAAFFAYRNIPKGTRTSKTADNKVRILAFDQKLWQQDARQIHHLYSSRENISVIEPLAIENDRMIPQQAAMTIANVDDIETYIKQWEGKTGNQYLFTYDLPAAEREPVMSELRFMGITAGSLFPGIDGACEELRERNFAV